MGKTRSGIIKKKKEVIIMQVEIRIDSSYTDPKIIILTASMTDDVNCIVKKYILRLRLYELEKQLPASQFIRISNSEIINLKKVNNFDLSFTGTICVKLSNGITTYVSRRYVPKLKKILGI